MAQHDLTEALQALVRRYGVSSVLHSLADIQAAPKQSASPLSSSRKRVSNPKSKSSAIDYVGKMTLPLEKAAVLTQAAQRFEDRKFLPSIGDIREFCRIYGVDLGKSTSRASSIPRIFTFLSAMDTALIAKLLDNGAFSGPARLGPIADAIRNRTVKRSRTSHPELTHPMYGKSTENRSKNQ